MDWITTIYKADGSTVDWEDVPEGEWVRVEWYAEAV